MEVLREGGEMKSAGEFFKEEMKEGVIEMCRHPRTHRPTHVHTDTHTDTNTFSRGRGGAHPPLVCGNVSITRRIICEPPAGDETSKE